MKFLITAIILSSGLLGTELIYISDNTKIDNLKILNNKYKKDLFINDNRVYLIPQECLLVRHFGGLSQNKLNLANNDSLSMPITQEIFTAKDENTIKVEVEKQKSLDLVTGKVTKEFLSDKDGHFFGGLSEIPIDLSDQITDAQNEYMIEKLTQTKTIEKIDDYSHPTCELLLDGSGYKLINTLNVKIFAKDILQLLTTTTIVFH